MWQHHSLDSPPPLPLCGLWRLNFAKQKGLFTSAPVLIQPDPSRQFIVEVDPLDSGVGAVLAQLSAPDQKLNPCAFFSRCLSPAECYYDVGNRELLAMSAILKSLSLAYPTICSDAHHLPASRSSLRLHNNCSNQLCLHVLLKAWSEQLQQLGLNSMQ